jgi:RNA polymerase sigma-70 factor (ECF subfamily)
MAAGMSVADNVVVTPKPRLKTHLALAVVTSDPLGDAQGAPSGDSTRRGVLPRRGTAGALCRESASGSLVWRCRRGDQAAWRELVERYSSYVAVIARAHRLRETEIEDLFQDVFERTWRQLHRIDGDDALRAWIGQVARRACIDRLRSAARIVQAPPEVLEMPAPDEMAQLTLAIDVREALRTLTPGGQAVLDAFFCRDLAYVRIADELGLAQGTIASRISRSLAELRETLAAYAA